MFSVPLGFQFCMEITTQTRRHFVWRFANGPLDGDIQLEYSAEPDASACRLIESLDSTPICAYPLISKIASTSTAAPVGRAANPNALRA